jgi:predicted glycoside hydrolase/deacetylase ChbG (UPF0249 family)
MSERYLIINADDYGMCQAGNEAVEDLFENGFITSTTLMTPCPWAQDALQRAKRNPKMHVGLHLTLNAEWEGYRWGPVSRTPVPSLLDDGGYLPRRVDELLKKATAADVVTEMEAQLNFFTSRGYRPTHMDNHMGSAYGLEGPSFLPEVFAFCAKNGFRFRLPRNPASFGEIPPELESTFSGVIAAADRLGVGILDQLLHFGRPFTSDDTYETLRQRYLDIICGIPEGVSELYVHPALDTPELRAACPAWQMRVWEHRFMKDPEALARIRESGVKLTTWIEAPLKKQLS